MCGRATLAIEVSSTSMNVPIVTTSAMIHGLKIRSGAKGSGAWAVAAEGGSRGSPGSNSGAEGARASCASAIAPSAASSTVAESFSGSSSTDSLVIIMTTGSLESRRPTPDSNFSTAICATLTR